jgi:hypothetical protein
MAQIRHRFAAGLGAALAALGLALACTPAREGEDAAAHVSREIDDAVEATRGVVTDAAAEARETGQDLGDGAVRGLERFQDWSRKSMEALRRSVMETWKDLQSRRSGDDAGEG